MRKLLLALWLAALWPVVFVSDLPAGEIPARNPLNRKYMVYPGPAVLPPEIRASAAPALSAASADTTLLAWFTFDNAGLADPQGWISADLNAQLDLFFHVAGVTELDGGGFGRLVPLEGGQSMWCGVALPVGDPFCNWAGLPGYGNNWDQILASSTFTCDSLFFCHKIAWDSEPGFDQTNIQYLDAASGLWVNLPADGGAGSYDGTGTIVECFSISVPAGSTRVRYLFASDGAFSDEDGLWPTDGAVIVDSITARCFNGGVLTQTLFEDFEGESPGAKQTGDGVWTAAQPPSFGDFSALYPGATLLQEDPCVVNTTHVWGWFDDPINTNYSCHTPDPRPDVGAVPFVSSGAYLNNEIWSPIIPFTGTGDEVRLSFKVYRDLPLDNLVFYSWNIRTFVAGCPSPFNVDPLLLNGPQRDWVEHSFQVGGLVGGADELQIRINVSDRCNVWCNIFGTGQCHGHAPLIDDVRLERINKVGPQFVVRHIDLFQDNFAQNGSLVGPARADAALDIAPASSPTIQPGDSATILVTGGSAGLATDPFTGIGPAAYAYVAVWPPGQAGKDGSGIEAPESRATVGKRYPLVDSLMHDGVQWYCFRMDSAVSITGVAQADRYALDLNDFVFNPCDTVCYLFSARDTLGNVKYWSRRLRGQGSDFVTTDLWEALNSPCEFSILPGGGVKRGGNILFVDDADDRSGPVQLFFDWIFDWLGILEQVDRYDVLGPSSNAGNGLGARVTNPGLQVTDSYKNIVWSSGDLASGLIGDGISPEKSDDFDILFTFLDTHPNNPGLFITGDNIANEWANLTGLAAVNLKSLYMNYTVLNGDHVAVGEPVSPLLTGVDSIFQHAGVPDQMIALGGCPSIRNFDVLLPAGNSVAELANTSSGQTYVLSQETPNSVASTARVVMAGFSLDVLRETAVGFPVARLELFSDILAFLQNVVQVPVGFDGEVPAPASSLAANYPNPFNPVTTIRYSIREPAPVSLRIYNAAGQLVRILVNEVQTPQPGGFAVTWDGRNGAGQAVSSGVYFYRLVAKDFTDTRKMVLLK